MESREVDEKTFLYTSQTAKLSITCSSHPSANSRLCPENPSTSSPKLRVRHSRKAPNPFSARKQAKILLDAAVSDARQSMDDHSFIANRL